MSNKKKLRDMLDNMIDDKNDQASVDFHEYLQGKMQDVIHGSPVDTETDTNTDSD